MYADVAWLKIRWWTLVDQAAGQLRSDVGKPMCAKFKTGKARSTQERLLTRINHDSMNDSSMTSDGI